MQQAAQVAGLTEIVEIDHARLAAAEGVEMPPSRVLISSDPAIDAAILQQQIRAGVDLPFRILSYSEAGDPTVSFTDAAFLARRHGIDDPAPGAAYDARLAEVIAAAEVAAAPAPVEGIDRDYGLIELTSTRGFDDTIASLRTAILAEGDTVWFGEVDFAARSADHGVTLPPATLLLFGGPAPGGVAMNAFPAIGLDAFCQKLLVYRAEDGSIRVLFNDIAALAELHYGTSAKPHHGLNERLTATFAKAIQ
jgi:uncharacterized protein (DUF302 family)